MNAKPIPRKAYGSVPHLIGSRVGPRDHHITEGQHRIATEKTRDRHDRVIVTEKLDGSCTAVLRAYNSIIAVTRAGRPAHTSPHSMHHAFSYWVFARDALFRDLLQEGERIVGEWLYQAHGTRYDLPHEPWAVFDWFDDQNRRIPHDQLVERLADRLPQPKVISDGPPLTIPAAMLILGTHGFHGAQDGMEGAVWRVERRGAFDFMAKYVRPDKQDGIYLPELDTNERTEPLLNTWSS